MIDLVGQNADIEGVKAMSHKIAGILEAASMSRFLRDWRICSGIRKNFFCRAVSAKRVGVKRILSFACGLLALGALAQEVTLTINTQSRGYEIPADFAGVSIF